MHSSTNKFALRRANVLVLIMSAYHRMAKPFPAHLWDRLQVYMSGARPGLSCNTATSKLAPGFLIDANDLKP